MPAKGDFADVESVIACQWVESGTAAFTIPCRAIREGCTVGNRVMGKDEEFETSEPHAAMLHAAGAAVILDRSRLKAPGQIVEPKSVSASSTLKMPSSYPVCKVKVLRDMFFVARNYAPGDVLDYPANLAEAAAKSGVIEIIEPWKPLGGIFENLSA